MLSTNLMRYFFQLGYVTPDLDRAIEQYRERFGISESGLSEPEPGKA